MWWINHYSLLSLHPIDYKIYSVQSPRRLYETAIKTRGSSPLQTKSAYNKALLVFGAGGHGSVVAETALKCGYIDIVFVDPQWPDFKEKGPWRVISDGLNLEELNKKYPHAISAIGSKGDTRHLQNKSLANAGFYVPSLVHPRAELSTYASIGAGSVMFAGSVVNYGAHLGDAVIINTGATIDHDCHIGDGVHIAPGAHLSGNVSVGQCSWIGVGASVRQGIKIGRNVVIGAGAAVVNNVGDDLIQVGVPAKVFSK